MGKRELVVCALWDDEAKVWVATSDDVPGLITEAENQVLLMKKLHVMIPELLDENGYADGDEVPFTLRTECHAVARRRATA